MEELIDKSKRVNDFSIDLGSEEEDKYEIIDLLNLLEVNEVISFEKEFKNQILFFLKKKKKYFNFKCQKKTPLLDYIYSYINASNYKRGKRKKINKNENFNKLKNNKQKGSLSSDYSPNFMNQNSKLKIPNKNNGNKTNHSSDRKINKNEIKEKKSNSLDDKKVLNKFIQ